MQTVHPLPSAQHNLHQPGLLELPVGPGHPEGDAHAQGVTMGFRPAALRKRFRHLALALGRDGHAVIRQDDVAARNTDVIDKLRAMGAIGLR